MKSQVIVPGSYVMGTVVMVQARYGFAECSDGSFYFNINECYQIRPVNGQPAFVDSALDEMPMRGDKIVALIGKGEKGQVATFWGSWKEFVEVSAECRKAKGQVSQPITVASASVATEPKPVAVVAQVETTSVATPSPKKKVPRRTPRAQSEMAPVIQMTPDTPLGDAMEAQKSSPAQATG